MRRHVFKSLGPRLIVTMIVIIAIVIVAYSAIAMRRGQGRINREIRTKGNLLARHLAYSARMGVFAENPSLLKENAESVVADEDVVAVEIYNADLRPLYRSDKRAVKTGPEPADAIRQALVASPDEERDLAGGDGTIAFTKPVVLRQYHDAGQNLYFDEQSAEHPERTIGFVRILLSKEYLNRQLRIVFATYGALAFMFIAVSAAVVYLWVRKAVTPLESLTQQVRALGTGGHVEEVHVESRDEIGRLAETFNVMLGERKKAEQALEKVLMDIHDGIGGITTNIALLSEVARQAPTAEDSARALQTIGDLARDGMAEVRSLMYSLDRDDLSWPTLAAELRNHATKYIGSRGTEFRMTTDIAENAVAPSSYLCLNLFKIYREALTNVVKHAQASKVSVQMSVDAQRLVLMVQDDGRGCPPEAFNGRGRGISNIMNRAREMNGTCSIRGDAGTCVIVEVPLGAKQPTA